MVGLMVACCLLGWLVGGWWVVGLAGWLVGASSLFFATSFWDTSMNVSGLFGRVLLHPVCFLWDYACCPKPCHGLASWRFDSPWVSHSFEPWLLFWKEGTFFNRPRQQQLHPPGLSLQQLHGFRAG